MAHPNRLIGFTFAAIGCAQHLECLWPTHHVQAAPKMGGNTPIARPTDEALEPALTNTLTPLTTELKLIARIVDRPGRIGGHENTIVDRRDHVIERG